MPALIYLVGFYILKPYVNGSLFALYFDFFKGLIELRPSCWTVILGPFVFLSLYPDLPASPSQGLTKVGPGKRELVHDIRCFRKHSPEM
jgi:hypothetical protein